MSTLFNNVGRFIRRIFLFLIIQGLSRHSKRMLFVTSLYYKLIDTDTISKDSLEQLNKALRVADNVDSMEFPAMIHNWIWDEELISCFYKTIDLHKDSLAFTKESLEDLLKVIPQWLWYGRQDDMLSDINLLLSNTYGVKTGGTLAS